MKKVPFWVAKSDAKSLLSGNWNIFVLVLFIPFLLYCTVMLKFTLSEPNVEAFLLSEKYYKMMSISALVVSFVFGIIRMGAINGMKQLSDGEKPSFFKIYGFGISNIGRYFPSYFISVLVPQIIAMFLTSKYIKIFYDKLMFSVMDYNVYEIMIFILGKAVFIGSIYLTYAMFFVPSILAVDKEISGWAAVKNSFVLTKEIKLHLFLLSLSFIGWGIAGMFAFFIGTLWVCVYIDATTYCYFKKITQVQEKIEIDDTSE